MNATATIAFIGGGNMAGGIIGGLVESGWSAECLFASDPDDARREQLSRRFGVDCFADNAQCAARGEAVVLAVKPQLLQVATEAVAPVLRRQQPLLLSIAAGIRAGDILRWAGAPLALVRAMPNTPALVNAGIAGLFATEQVDARQRELAQTILQSVGKVVWVEREEMIDLITAISGSGPAYFFKLMELLADSAVGGGLDRVAAETLAVQTAAGAAALAQRESSAQSLATLRRQVTSPGGTTEAALRAMEEHGLDAAVQQGVAAAARRAATIADEFGAD
ncbi:MAG: pyrroline-5-carboxylate reductase [bacterium]